MDDFIYRLGQLYQQMLFRRRNEDYTINPVQMDRFLDLLRFFRHKADPEFDLGIEPFHLEAKEECGGFSSDFCIFDLYGDEVREFCAADLLLQRGQYRREDRQSGLCFPDRPAPLCSEDGYRRSGRPGRFGFVG